MNQPLVETRPPDDFAQVARWVLDSPAELARLRGELTLALTGRPSGPQRSLGTVPEKMVLVASELATNALRHGLPPTTVTLLRKADECLLDVADNAPGVAPFVPSDRGAGEGGHGLRLAELLAADVGWYTTDETKHVWACFEALT